MVGKGIAVAGIWIGAAVMSFSPHLAGNIHELLIGVGIATGFIIWL